MSDSKSIDFDGIKKEFEEKFVDVIFGTHNHERSWEDSEGFIGSPKEVWSFIESKLQEVRQEEKEKTINAIIVYFDLMVFDNTKKDELVNIMEFRKKQREYLLSLLEEEI